MLEIEERFFDEYKRVDNFCRDALSSRNGINQYITEMKQEQNSFYGCSVVPLWDRDIHMLQRVQQLRNKIAHEPSVTDCNNKDVAWLEDFHRRLLEQQDPLTLLSRAGQKRSNYHIRREMEPKTDAEQYLHRNSNLQNKKASSNKTIVALIVFVEIFIIIATVTVLFIYY